MQTDERNLVEQFINGDDIAFQKIVDNYEGLIRKIYFSKMENNSYGMHEKMSLGYVNLYEDAKVEVWHGLSVALKNNFIFEHNESLKRLVKVITERRVQDLIDKSYRNRKATYIEKLDDNGKNIKHYNSFESIDNPNVDTKVTLIPVADKEDESRFDDIFSEVYVALSERERKICSLASDNLLNETPTNLQMIAEQLGVSLSTVKNDIKRIKAVYKEHISSQKVSLS